MAKQLSHSGSTGSCCRLDVILFDVGVCANTVETECYVTTIERLVLSYDDLARWPSA
jgi:hypothetical protein